MATEKPAFLFVPVKDYFDPNHPIPMTFFARRLIDVNSHEKFPGEPHCDKHRIQRDYSNGSRPNFKQPL